MPGPPSPDSGPGAPRRWRERPSAGALVIALALPFMLVHAGHQPVIAIGSGATGARISLSDLAVAVVVAAAVLAVARGRRPRLGGGRTVVAFGVGFLGLVLLGALLPALGGPGGRAALLTAGKYVAYGALVAAVPVLIRRPRDLAAPAAVLAAWTGIAAIVAAMQFTNLRGPLHALGSPTAFDAWFAGDRQPSFLGTHDLAALGALVTATGVALLVAGGHPVERRLGWVALATGLPALLLSGAAAGSLGALLAIAGAGLWVLRRRAGRGRAILVAAVGCAVVLGVLGLRAEQFTAFADTRGGTVAPSSSSSPAPGSPQGAPELPVQSYDQRLLLADVGLRVFFAQPLTGAGWQGSLDEEAYGPHLAGARERFPGQPEYAFPSPEHPWGPHNHYIQALADLGIGGLVLLVGTLVAAIAVTARRAEAGVGAAIPLAACLGVVALAGVANGTGVYAGVPSTALLWLTLGAAAVAARTP